MTRKRNRRMHPAGRDPLAAFKTMENCREPTSDEVAIVMNDLRLAYEKLKAGHGTDDDLAVLGAMANTGSVRAEAIGQPLVDAFQLAGRALQACESRKQRARYGFDGPGILSMNAALDLYAELLSMSSVLQMDAARKEAWRRLRAHARVPQQHEETIT